MRATCLMWCMLAVLALGLAGCTADGPRYVPAATVPAVDAGVIYVYRPLGTIGTRGESPFVSINGKSHGPIKAGSYITATVPAGDVKVTVQQSVLMLVPTIPRSITVTVASGGSAYVRVDQTIDSASLSGGVTVMQSVAIEEVASERAQEELEETRENG